MVDKVSFAIAYPVAGYQSPSAGFNPLDVVGYYLSEKITQDWNNYSVPLALSVAHQPALYASHWWTDGTHWQWAHDLATNQQLSMQDLHNRHGHPVLPEHPVFTNQELANFVGFPQLSLIIDPTQGDPHRVPDGVWYKMLNGGNNNGWTLVEQWDKTKWHAGWPGDNPRQGGQGQGKGKK